MIKIKNISKKFYPRCGFFKKKEIKALKNVSLEVKDGELFTLLGPNGAGKTTLIKILSTLIIPDSGNAFINGYDLKEEGKIRSQIGLVLGDERSFYFRLSGFQNLAFFAALQNLFGKEAKKRIEKVLDLVSLSDSAHIQFQNYSRGMKQRLSLARGLLHNPEILFLDEPTAGLDPLASSSLRKFIKKILVKKEKKTIFLITQNLEEAKEISDKLAIIDKGEIKFVGKNLKTSKQILEIFQRVTKHDS